MSTILDAPVADCYHEIYPGAFLLMEYVKNAGLPVTYPGPLVGENIVAWAERVRFEPGEVDPALWGNWRNYDWPIGPAPPVSKEVVEDILQRIEERRAQCGGAKDLNW